MPLTFNFNFLVKAKGMLQFHVIRADRELQIYASPVNLDPRDPPIPISHPEEFSKKLADAIGLYRTIGWAEATWPLNDGRMDEATFLYDAERAFDDREKIFFERMKTDDWDLFVAAIETTDRVSHMMWRLIDPKHPMYDAALAARHGGAIERVYRRADDLVGRIQAKLPPDALFIVMSDHGFHSFRRGVNLNTWLVQNGYQVFEGQESASSSSPTCSAAGKFWEGVDWSRTRAYAVGLGQIYFNLRGREGAGHRLRGRRVQGAAGRDRGQARRAEGSRHRRAGHARGLPPRRHLQGRIPAVRARPAGGIQRRLPRGLAGHHGRDHARRGREQQPQVERRPLRHRHRDQRRRLLQQPQVSRTPRRRSWTWRPPS